MLLDFTQHSELSSEPHRWPLQLCQQCAPSSDVFGFFQKSLTLKVLPRYLPLKTVSTGSVSDFWKNTIPLRFTPLKTSLSAERIFFSIMSFKIDQNLKQHFIQKVEFTTTLTAQYRIKNFRKFMAVCNLQEW